MYIHSQKAGTSEGKGEGTAKEKKRMRCTEEEAAAEIGEITVVEKR